MSDEHRHPAAVWGPRMCAAAPIVVAVSLVVGFLDPHGGESVLAASAFGIAFLAVASAFFGGFLCLFASEKVAGFARPKWATPCAIVGISGGFGSGLLALVT